VSGSSLFLCYNHMGDFMGKYSEIHIKLEELVNNFLECQSDENSSLIISEIVNLIVKDADVLIDGNESKTYPGQYEPSGYEGNDGRFYFHVFTSKLRFDESDAKKPMVCKLNSILNSVFNNEYLGGISLNYQKGKGTVLVSKEDIKEGLEVALNAKK